jgi:hypothetical protein
MFLGDAGSPLAAAAGLDATEPCGGIRIDRRSYPTAEPMASTAGANAKVSGGVPSRLPPTDGRSRPTARVR